MAVKPTDLRALYRALLRNSARFSDYNFREYAVRRTRDAFREHKNQTDPTVIDQLYRDGLNNLNIIERQAAISQMFKTNPIVIDN